MSEELMIFEIPEENIHEVIKRIEKLNKRAKKLGSEKIELVTHEIKRLTELVEDSYGQYEKFIKVHVVSVTGNAPSFKGWKFIARYGHDYDPSIMLKSPEETVPAKYFDLESKCDHCNHKRYRRNTYLVQNIETSKYKQVGSSCIKDFLGHTHPKFILSFFENINSLEVFLSSGEITSANKYFYNIIDILTTTAAVVRNFGWISSGKAREDSGLVPTAATVSEIICGSKNSDYVRKLRADCLPTDNDYNLAEKALEWAKNIDNKNDSEYIHVIKRFANMEEIKSSEFGIVASIVGSYFVAEERSKKQESENKNRSNEWLGEKKQRVESIVTVLNLHGYDNGWGGGILVKMVDAEGHSLTWFSSGTTMEVKKTYKVKMTIKNHDEYKGWKQTIVNRVKVLKSIDTEN